MIIKIASGEVHTKCEKRLGQWVANFSDQYPGIFDPDGDGEHRLVSGTIVAPDAFMQPVSPPQPAGKPYIRSPLIIEFEFKHRGPKALLEVISSYFTGSPVEYCLGIKVYERTGPAVQAGRRPFAAVAILWRRHPTNRNRARVSGFWSFGTTDLSGQSKAAFRTKRGVLDKVADALVVYPAVGNQITIPHAHLVQIQVDSLGQPVAVAANATDLTIDLNVLVDICDRKLPP